MDRRTFIKWAAGGTVVIAAGGLAWRAYGRGVFSTGEGPAYEPWKNWNTDGTDRALNVVRAAILAANPHNIQPWLFKIMDGRIDLFSDDSRSLGTVDPFGREKHIGLGCALENALLAANAAGYGCRLKLLPDGLDPAHIASIELSEAEKDASGLYQAIPHRHTNRGPYDKGRGVSQDTLTALQALNEEADISILWFSSDDGRKKVGDLIVRATEAFIADREQSGDSARWMREDWHAVQTHRDGLTLDAQGLPWYMDIAAKILPPQSPEQNDRFWVRSTRDTQVSTAGAFGIIVARDDRDIVQRLKAGRLWQRMHLRCTNESIALQPMNQVIERSEREVATGSEPIFGDALTELVGDESRKPLMQFRVGYPLSDAGKSPRRAVEDVLVR